MEKVVVNTNTFDAILQASPVVQVILFILVVLSVVCWAIAFSKYRQLKTIRDANAPFLNRFWKTTSLDNLNENLLQYANSPLARVFRAGYNELQRLAESPQIAILNSTPSSSAEKSSATLLSGSDNLERTLRKAIDSELSLMESRLTVLATTGSTGPFIGLFGTVWGIMGSFHKIGQTGSASLAVVAPGISEALITTAIGLAAAIPAVVMYNHFVSAIKKEEVELNNFSADFMNIVKRNFFKGE